MDLTLYSILKKYIDNQVIAAAGIIPSEVITETELAQELVK